MTDATVATSIAELSGTLQPVSGTTQADLDRARSLLASAIQSGQSSTAIQGAAKVGENTLLNEQAKNFLHLVGTAPVVPTRAFLRVVPSPTGVHPFTPAAARGIAVDESAGPFLTSIGSPVWIDSFKVAQLTPVTRVTTNLVGLFPVDPARSTPQKLVLKAGSVWFPATLLAANSPQGSFTGFRIKGGTLSFREPVVPLVGGYDLTPSNIATLTVDLDPPAAPPPAGTMYLKRRRSGCWTN